MEIGSGMAFKAKPATCPRLLIEDAELWFPPKVPRSTMFPSFHITARVSITPKSESITPVSDCPAISPLSLIPEALLQFWSDGGSEPRSVIWRLCRRSAWLTFDPGKHRTPLLFGGRGTAVCPVATVSPLLLMYGAPFPDGLIKPWGPPKVPKSMSLYLWWWGLGSGGVWGRVVSVGLWSDPGSP